MITAGNILSPLLGAHNLVSIGTCFHASDSGKSKTAHHSCKSAREIQFLKSKAKSKEKLEKKIIVIFNCYEIYFIAIFLHFRLGNMSYFYSIQHRLSDICLPVLTCLLLFQPTLFPVSNFWSSTLDPVSHIKWNQKINFRNVFWYLTISWSIEQLLQSIKEIHPNYIGVSCKVFLIS